MSFNASSFLKTSSLWTSSVILNEIIQLFRLTDSKTTTTQRGIWRRENQYLRAMTDEYRRNKTGRVDDHRMQIVYLHFVIKRARYHQTADAH